MTFRHLAISAAGLTASAAALATRGGSKASGTAQGAVTPRPRSSHPSPEPATKIHDGTAHTATAGDGQSFDTGAITPPAIVK